ncbi:DNA polymerase III subunit delta [Siphonobacter curvatus]|uniref:DNA polymerase III subunit delta n=1 Tax=Siphonobacter curvatus TaxID=2094562 RepID=A0A2S7IQ02_9BACT|nr:DNA polymerase III subunit delta [Siphonobacter curvatus]PQA59797.1 DNA polymerase III subunit delta [Siphonobacter curvatus]
MPQTFETVWKELKKNQYAPLYLLAGDEPYYTDQLASYLEENALPASARDFNQFVLYGKDINVGTLLSYAKRFPMLSDRQLILVKEAQDMQGLDAKDTVRFLEDYIVNPLPSTILVLCFKSNVDERKAWVKAWDKKGVYVPSKKLYDNKIPDWIASYCHEKGVKISPKALQMLSEFIGNDLKRIANELDKIILNLRADESIQAETVERFVGVSREFNNFELQKALLNRDVARSNLIAYHFSRNPKDNPIQPTLIILYNFFSKLLLTHATADKSERNLASTLGVNPFFAKDYVTASRNFSLDKTVSVIKYLRQADAQSKGVEVGVISEEVILKDLIFKILH